MFDTFDRLKLEEIDWKRENGFLVDEEVLEASAAEKLEGPENEDDDDPDYVNSEEEEE